MEQIIDTIIIKEKRPVGRPRKLDKVIKEKRPVGRPKIEKIIKEKKIPIRIRDRKEYQHNYYQEKTKKNKPELEIKEEIKDDTTQRDKNIINFIVSDVEEMVEMKRGKDIKRFSGVFIDNIGYFQYE
jgi:hypothetical protein